MKLKEQKGKRKRKLPKKGTHNEQSSEEVNTDYSFYVYENRVSSMQFHCLAFNKVHFLLLSLMLLLSLQHKTFYKI